MAIHVQIKHLITSNVSAAADKASDPEKMLKLLRREVEDAIVAVQGELSGGERKHRRLLDNAAKLEASVDEWNAKAKTAIDHGREDLARSALLAREDACATAKKDRAAAEELGGELAELRDDMSALEARLREVGEELVNCADARAASVHDAAGKDTKADRRMDRIDALVRRAGFSQPANDEPSKAAVEREIEELQRTAKVDADLAALKGAGGKTGAGKAAKPRKKKA